MYARSVSTLRQRGVDIRRGDIETQELAQDGCIICHDNGDGGARPLALVVDHDPQTGAPRGLVCFRCNQLISLVESNRPLVKWVEMYLDQGGVWDA